MPYYRLRKEISQTIKSLRLEKEITQEKAAESIGFHYKYYQKIESGVVNLTLDSIEKIAKAFKVNPRDLFSKR